MASLGWFDTIILPVSFVVGVFLWLLPPATFCWAAFTGADGILLTWGALTTGLSLLIWCSASGLMKSNPLYGFLYPLGATLGLYIFFKSWQKGTRIQWKGRDYEMTHRTRIRPPTDSPGESAGDRGSVS